VGEWVWSKALRYALAGALLEEVNELYTRYVGPLVKPDGAPVPLAERVAAVASARAVPWLFPAGEYVAIARVPRGFATVLTLRDLANLVGGIYWESEGVVLVKPDALAAFITARETRIAQLIGQA